MLYIQVSITENGLVINKDPQELPKNWKNISNLNRLSESELAKEGWFPVIGEQPSFSTEKEVLVGPILHVDFDRQTKNVIARHTWKVSPKGIDDLREEHINAIKATYFRHKKTFFKDFDFDANILKVNGMIAEKGVGETWTDLKQLELKELMTLLQRFDSLHRKMKTAISKIVTARNIEEMKQVTEEYGKIKV